MIRDESAARLWDEPLWDRFRHDYVPESSKQKYRNRERLIVSLDGRSPLMKVIFDSGFVNDSSE